MTHLHAFDCSENVDLGATEELLAILGRGYPRVAAGRVRTIESDPLTRDLYMEGEALAAGQELLLWTPTTAETHHISSEGLEKVQLTNVDGGRLVTGIVSQVGMYHVRVSSE